MSPTLNARGRRTVAAVEAAALTATDELPFDQITVREISTRAGVSERVFFNHFATREDAFLGNEQPTVVESWARELMTDVTIPLFTGAAKLVALPAVAPEVQRRRMELLRTQPALLARAHELLAPLREQCRGIVSAALRLRHPQLPTHHVDRLARLVVAAAAELLDVDALDSGFAESLRTIRDELA